MRAELVHRFGALLKWAATRLLAYRRPSAIWIDVGAHLDEMTFSFAQENPCLTVYAFEPNLEVAIQRMGRLPNYVVIPMAVAEHDGCTDFYINALDVASSILPFNPEGHRQWIGGEKLAVHSKATVAATRLDTFMNLVGISQVDFLKIDAQGAKGEKGDIGGTSGSAFIIDLGGGI